MCQHHQVYTTMWKGVSISQIFFPKDETSFHHATWSMQWCKVRSLEWHWMTDMQTSLPILIVRPSNINLVINFSTHLWSVKWNALGYTFALHIPFLPMSMQHMHQHDQQWYDPLYIIMWPYWFIDLDLTCSSPLHRSIGAKSLLKLHHHTVHRSKASNLPFTLATTPSSQALSWSSPP